MHILCDTDIQLQLCVCDTKQTERIGNARELQMPLITKQLCVRCTTQKTLRQYTAFYLGRHSDRMSQRFFISESKNCVGNRICVSVL